MALTPEQMFQLSRYLAVNDNSPSEPIALCELKDGTIRYAYHQRVQQEPRSAGTVLLQGMLDGSVKPKDLTGAKLYTRLAPDEMVIGMAGMLSKGSVSVQQLPTGVTQKTAEGMALFKALGKLVSRVTFDDTPKSQLRFVCPKAPSPNLDLTSGAMDKHTGYRSIHRMYLMAAYALLNLHDEAQPEGKYVGAIMVSKTGQILAWGVNTNGKNKTLHAEVNMLQSYRFYTNSSAGIPSGARIYTTLQCCKMCSAMVFDSAKSPSSIKVYYGMTDPSQERSKTKLGDEGMEALLGEPGDGLRGIKTASKANLAEYLNAEYQAKRGMDAASYGKKVDRGEVTGVLQTKFTRNTTGAPDKTVNPKAVAAVQHIRLFLNHIGAADIQ